MALFINTTESIGIIMGEATRTTTGSLFGALLAVLLILICICIMFGIGLEWIMIFLLPYNLACMAWYSNFIAPTACMIIYLAIIITKSYLFR